MSKTEFLNNLRIGLVEAGVSPVQDIIDFYDEGINDRMDAGMDEESAVAALGNIDDIVKNHLVDMPMPKVVKYKIKESHENAKKKGNGVVWIILAILGFPFWFPVLVVLGSMLLVFYLVLWTIIISFFVVEFAIGAAAVACLVAAFGLFTNILPFAGTLLSIGAALVLAGICILLWKPIVALASFSIDLIKLLFKGIKKLFV